MAVCPPCAAAGECSLGGAGPGICVYSSSLSASVAIIVVSVLALGGSAVALWQYRRREAANDTSAGLSETGGSGFRINGLTRMLSRGRQGNQSVDGRELVGRSAGYGTSADSNAEYNSL